MDPVTISSIVGGVGKAIDSIGNIFLGNKKLNNEAKVIDNQYNLTNTELRGSQNLDRWSLLLSANTTDKSTGYAILGVFALILIVYLIVKK